MKSSRRRSPRLPRSTDKTAEQSEKASRERPQRRKSKSATRERSQRSRSRKRVFEEETINVQKSDVSTAPLLPIHSPNFQKKVVEGHKCSYVDSFCWVCHKLCDEMICDACPRAYHTTCFNKGDPQVCDCKRRHVVGKNPHFIMSPVELRGLLVYAIHEAGRDDKKNAHKIQKLENTIFYKLLNTWPTHPENNKLIKIVDLVCLMDDANNSMYKSTADFFSDVKWIYHNCCIMYGADNEKTQTALKLQKNFLRELTDIEACRDCYQNKNSARYGQDHYANWFIKVCRVPHDIVWAKLRGSPFWPAKCLKIEKGHADVRFFGTHDKSVISLKQIYHISKAHPEGKNTKRMSKLNEAMEELYLYISNYEKEHEPFEFFEKKTPFREAHSKGKKKLQRKENCSPAVVPEKASTSDSVETKVKAIMHTPFTSSDDDFSGLVENDSDSNVHFEMLFTADGETSDSFSENLIKPTTFYSAEHDLDDETSNPESDLLSSCEFSNFATASQNNIVSYENVHSPFPVISVAQSTREDNAIHILASTQGSSAAENDACLTPGLEPDSQSASEKQLQKFEVSAGQEEEEDSDNEIQIVHETPPKRLTDFFFRTTGGSTAVDKTVAELLLSNKPRFRELFDLYRNFSSRLFFAMLVESSSSGRNPNAKLNLLKLVLEVIRKMESLKKENIEAKEKNSELEKQLTEFKVKLSEQDKVIEKGKKMIEEKNELLEQCEKENCELMKEKIELEERINIEIEQRERLEVKNKETEFQVGVTRGLLQESLCRSKSLSEEAKKAYENLESEKNKSLEEKEKLLEEKEKLLKKKGKEIKELQKSNQELLEILRSINGEQCSDEENDIIEINSDGCQVDEATDSICSEQNGSGIESSSGLVLKSEESQIHCDNSNSGLILLQRNISAVANTSSGSVFCKTSVMTGCSYGAIVPPPAFLQLPVVVSTAPILQPPSYLNSNIQYGCVVASTSSQPNIDVSASYPKAIGSCSSSSKAIGSSPKGDSSKESPSSSQRPSCSKAKPSGSRAKPSGSRAKPSGSRAKPSNSKVSHHKSSNALKRRMAEVEVISIKKCKKDE